MAREAKKARKSSAWASTGTARKSKPKKKETARCLMKCKSPKKTGQRLRSSCRRSCNKCPDNIRTSGFQTTRNRKRSLRRPTGTRDNMSFRIEINEDICKSIIALLIEQQMKENPDLLTPKDFTRRRNRAQVEDLASSSTMTNKVKKKNQ
ncbi:uncharacterized protein LOC143435511 [Arvicanthis niloticus]|uniref:uncharacterized protein LOC143309813 n=1 Tax=Arvicanthis niloticus TaxID=61156 RepID=UPI00402B1214